jgi:eukaryotic-like serine/threonine-protein kinase
VTADRWQQVKAALHELMQLGADARLAHLERIGATDPSLRVELDSLLSASDQVSSDFLSVPAIALEALDELPLRDPMLGRRLGPYRILERIGAGGMGEVYRAVRADDEYQQQVAIKLVHSGFASSFVLNRLRQERQILASLDHPNITRLLDGGTTPEGVPYLVMELIDGEPIHRFCKRLNFDTDQKLRLFIQVCLAVHYAHQRLIIHRDIKPGNILVMPTGVPKLLDFGIAKILDQAPGSRKESSPETASVIRLFTPAYASPEQLKGETITTSSDVYSLGVVLHELLTGCMPDEAARRTTLGVNLDNIIRMAMRPEPERRYSSAEGLATDLRHHLEHLPVIARRNTLKYRLSTFVARHTSAVAASALLMIALVAATFISLHEAQVARTERARAERRFNDARRLANSLMREIYSSIKDLPGATSARKLLVSKALEYLDGLAGDALSDPALEHELAIAYSLVGDVQGNPYYANLGNPSGALQSYRKALDIRLRLSSAAPADASAVREVAGSYNQIGSELGVMRDFAGAVSHFEAAARLLEPVDRDSSDPKVLDQLAGTYYYLTEAAVRVGDLARAANSIRRASAIRDGIVTDDSTLQRLIRTHSAADHAAASRVLLAQGKFAEALVEQRKAVNIVSVLAEENPGDATIKSYVGQGLNYLGQIQEDDGDPSGALSSYRQSNQALEPILAVDPQNTFALTLIAHDDERIGALEHRAGLRAVGSRDIARAIALISPLSAQDPDNSELSAQIAHAYADLGDAKKEESTLPHMASQRRAQQLEAACASYRKSLDVWRALQRRGSLDALEKTGDTPAAAAQTLADCEAQLAHVSVANCCPSPAVPPHVAKD